MLEDLIEKGGNILTLYDFGEEGPPHRSLGTNGKVGREVNAPT